MTKGICKLCIKEKPLLKKSHIVSDFLHKEMYDENHKLRAFDPKDLLKENPRISRPSTGSYEGGILCNECDNQIIGTYESYAAELINGKLSKVKKPTCHYSRSIDGVIVLELSKLDYSKIKLFLLSLLWRADISSRNEYDDVQLGPYSEKIRKQLLENDPSEDTDIIISITKFDPLAGFSNFIGQPVRYKFENTTAYSIIINGYLIVFHLKENRVSKKIHHHRLKQDGTLTILEVPKIHVRQFVMTYVGITRK